MAFPFMFMFECSRAFMFACTFALLVFEFAAFAAGVAAVLAFAELVLRAEFVLSAVEQPATRTLSASDAVSASLLIPSLPYPTGVKSVRAS